MAEKKTPKISIGITSMTVILCILCLTVFSVLTLSTALSERELSRKRAEAAEEYYRAERQAAEMANGLIDAPNALDFAEKNQIVTVTEGEKQVFRYAWPIDENQELSVELVYANDWKVTRWQVVSTESWTPDESLNVWDGEIPLEE